MDSDHLAQFRRFAAQAQGLDRIAMETGHRARLIIHMMVNERNFCRFGIIAEQLQVNVGQAGGCAVPNGTAQMGAKRRHALHPDQGQLAQRAQFARLGVGAKESDVLAHSFLHLVVAGQRGAGGQAHFAQRAALGGAPLHPFLDDDAGGGIGDFGTQRCVHGANQAVEAPLWRERAVGVLGMPPRHSRPQGHGGQKTINFIAPQAGQPCGVGPCV